MSNETKKTAVPKLRFPEFRQAGEWEVGFLTGKGVAVFVNEKIPVEELTLASYVSTENLLADYGGLTVASKLPASGSFIQFKQGDILVSNIRPYLKKVWTANINGASSNDVIVIRAKEKISAAFLSFLLKNDCFIDYMMKGAEGVKMPRGDKELIREYPLALPEEKEQQKIAATLSSLDDLLTAQSAKLAALQAHKRGLMQGLFPAEGETVPKLRFPEFREAGEWEEKKLEEVAAIKSGSTPLRSNILFYKDGKTPWVKTTDLNNGFIFDTQEKVTKHSNVRINEIGSVLVAMYGGFNQIGRTGYLKIPAATNQALSVINTKKSKVHSLYLLMWLNAKVYLWKKFAGSSRKDPNITGNDVAVFPILFPSLKEQQKIADCLSSLDDLIAAQSQKIEALKLHKKGLMQALFPAVTDVE